MRKLLPQSRAYPPADSFPTTTSSMSAFTSRLSLSPCPAGTRVGLQAHFPLGAPPRSHSFHTAIVTLAVPKNRRSSAHKRERTAYYNMKPRHDFHSCSNCKRPVLFAHVCGCGWYKGKPYSMKAIAKENKRLEWVSQQEGKPETAEATSS
eukprot:TRINITY_DN285_c0_g1_i1.p1 TRINITY_DN285_c0_g1~~TRINITY_DN285_c0_g1_i1.p1  ORF type:complete len:150 (+),score=19.69 TRINITY_DN285_c0_g1_i1:215-664(+)